MKIISPIQGEVLKEINEDTYESLSKKYEAACIAQKKWKEIPLKNKTQVLEKFCELTEKHKDTLARDLTLEMGKPLKESHQELKSSRARIKFFIEQAEKYLSPGLQKDDGRTQDILELDPLGVIANISAWNYPYNIGANVWAPALLTGNAILYKPSEFATLTGLHIEKLFLEAGLPEGVFTTVVGGGAIGIALCEMPLDGYFFVGSYKTGKAIAENVSKKLVPVGLELGGNDPLYVTDEVKDLNEVVDSALEGVFYNNGQSCCAVKRIYVHKNKYEVFIHAFTEKAKALKVGNPLDESNQQGALARVSHLTYLEELIQDAQKKGAKLLAGGRRILEGSQGEDLSKGAFFEPTVLGSVTHQMRIMKEEPFGPVIGVMSVQDDAEAIRYMNDTEYGLTAAVYSSNIERAKSILKQVESGTAYINCCDRVTAYLPWNGRKHSGLRGTLSFLGFYEFVQPRGWQIRN